MDVNDLFIVAFIEEEDLREGGFIGQLDQWLVGESCRYSIKTVLLGDGRRGRGAFLKEHWGRAGTDFLLYLDRYSMIDREGLRDVLKALSEGNDIVAGSRLQASTRGKRPLVKKWISQGYNFLLRWLFDLRDVMDAQCHVKAARRETVQSLLSQIKSDRSFFDTELLVLARKHGLCIREVPVAFTEPSEKMGHLFRYFWEDVRNILRLKRQVEGRDQHDNKGGTCI